MFIARTKKLRVTLTSFFSPTIDHNCCIEVKRFDPGFHFYIVDDQEMLILLFRMISNIRSAFYFKNDFYFLECFLFLECMFSIFRMKVMAMTTN